MPCSACIGMNPEPDLGSLRADIEEHQGADEPVRLGVGKCEDGQRAGRQTRRNFFADHPSHGLGGVVRLGQVAEAPHSLIPGAGRIRVCVQLVQGT